MRRLAFTAAARAQFFTYIEDREAQVAAINRLLAIAKDPEKALALVGADTRIRRANIAGHCFFVLPVERSENFPTPLLLVMKVRSRDQ